MSNIVHGFKKEAVSIHFISHFLSHRYSFTHVYHRMGAYIYLRIFIQLQNSLNLMFKVLVMPNTVMNCISIYLPGKKHKAREGTVV